MMYNKAELTAMQIIVGKLDWHKPVDETVETICKMVSNQQALELDCVGECDDFEETLLSLALWDSEKILSTLYVNDYHSLMCFQYTLFLESMGITDSDYKAMLNYYVNIAPESLAALYEVEDEFEASNLDYQLECYQEAMWISEHC